MSMNVILSDKLAEFVRTQVASGRYRSSSEVVSEALRLMEKIETIESEKLGLLQQAWRDGVDSGDAGELDFENLKKDARARFAVSKA